MTHGRGLGALIFLCGIVAATACGPSHELSSASPASLSAGLEAFQSTVYSLGQSKKCSNCHAQTFNPHWMSPDLREAYALTKRLVDFKNPTASLLVEFSSNAHCRTSECSDPTTSEAMKTQLQNWAAVELGL